MLLRSLYCAAALATVSGFAPAARAPGLVLRGAVRPAAFAARPALPALPALPTASVVMAEAAAAEPEKDSMMETLTTGSFFALWYLFNIGYNIYNKKTLNSLPIPYTIAALQLFVGIPYCFALWTTGLRKAPKLSLENVKTLIPVSLGHLGTHIGAVVSLGAGAVSFTHIVKASEPVVSAALSFVLLGSVMSPVTYLTLLPIVGGVALASLKELSFTWLGFIAAMVSNFSSALRGEPARSSARTRPTSMATGTTNQIQLMTTPK